MWLCLEGPLLPEDRSRGRLGSTGSDGIILAGGEGMGDGDGFIRGRLRTVKSSTPSSDIGGGGGGVGTLRFKFKTLIVSSFWWVANRDCVTGVSSCAILTFDGPFSPVVGSGLGFLGTNGCGLRAQTHGLVEIGFSNWSILSLDFISVWLLEAKLSILGVLIEGLCFGWNGLTSAFVL